MPANNISIHEVNGIVIKTGDCKITGESYTVEVPVDQYKAWVQDELPISCEDYIDPVEYDAMFPQQDLPDNEINAMAEQYEAGCRYDASFEIG